MEARASVNFWPDIHHPVVGKAAGFGCMVGPESSLQELPGSLAGVIAYNEIASNDRRKPDFLNQLATQTLAGLNSRSCSMNPSANTEAT